MTDPVSAIIFSPADEPFDIGHARTSLAHMARRGYQIVAVIRDWLIVERLLRSNTVQVVLFAHGCRDPLAPTPDESPTRPVGESARRRALRGPDRQSVAAGATQLLAERVDLEVQQDAATAELVDAYREGYADGFVDCLTIQGSPTCPL